MPQRARPESVIACRENYTGGLLSELCLRRGDRAALRGGGGTAGARARIHVPERTTSLLTREKDSPGQRGLHLALTAPTRTSLRP
jgi:hypothetical protein